MTNGTVHVGNLPCHLVPVRRGEFVHAVVFGNGVHGIPECGKPQVEAVEPEYTGEPVDCEDCVAMIGVSHEGNSCR